MKKLVIGINSCVDCLDSFRLFREFKFKAPWECPITSIVYSKVKPPEQGFMPECPLREVMPEEKASLDADREQEIRRLAVEGMKKIMEGMKS